VSEQVHTEMSQAQTAVLRALAAAPGESDLAAVSERVARAVAEAEPPDERARIARRYAEMMQSQRFLPSIPILANAGRSGNLAACYVLEPQDSLASIYAALTRAALIQQGAGGAGVNFSNLRPAGAPIHRSGGRSPGPLAFVELFAHSAQVNRRSGRRPGAHLAVLEIGHPDVGDFVSAARGKTERLSGMGLALGLTEAFLRAAASGESFELRHPAAPEARAVRADALLRDIAEAIIASGEPSLLFLDTIEAANPAPHLGPIRATNPCGEQPLLPGESCVLGSIQLPVFARDGGELDWKALGDTVADAVRFLDATSRTKRCRAPRAAPERSASASWAWRTWPCCEASPTTASRSETWQQRSRASCRSAPAKPARRWPKSEPRTRPGPPRAPPAATRRSSPSPRPAH
jgi:ribonucleoside-diphosphate reductase alpha chain